MRRFTPYLSILVVLGSALAGCGGGSEATADTEAPSSTNTVETSFVVTEVPVVTEPAVVPVFPLTGLPIVDPAAADRPAIIAKIDNAPGARPQTGLVRADIVYEENVESWTRFAAIFHSQGSDPVGPLRSGRTQDISLGTSLVRPLLVWSGGNAKVTSAISKSELVNMSVSQAGPNGGYYRSSEKRAPHNLFTGTSDIWALDEGRGGRPVPQFEFRDGGDPVPGRPAVGVKLRMDGSMRASWEWNVDLGLYERDHEDDPHVEADGTRVTTHNVVVVFCEYERSDADPRSPEAQTTGTGRAWIFTGGNVVEGTWSRADIRSPWELFDDSGARIGLTPGRIWVELIRDEQAVVVPAGAVPDDVEWP